jgi:C4-dicarboxylate transporter DctQ subunit
MGGKMQAKPQGGVARIIDQLEETLIAVLLGLMTMVTFANVVARYIFDTNILWALEVTVFLFAWLVLLGISYGVKHSIHIGVDVVVRLLPKGVQKILTLVAVSACLAFCFLMLKGAWDYWYPFATSRAWLETDDVPMPAFLQFMADWLNEGERYEKMPRFIPYFALPLGMALLTFRFLQSAWRILTGQVDLIIAGHEVEEQVTKSGSNESANSAEKEG